MGGGGVDIPRESPICVPDKLEMIFEHKRGNSPSINMIEFVGNASSSNNEIVLTPSFNSQQGAIWLKNKVNLLSGFVSSFEFKITKDGADGFAFCLQNSSQRAMGKKKNIFIFCFIFYFLFLFFIFIFIFYFYFYFLFFIFYFFF